jgi:hypothetical protein
MPRIVVNGKEHGDGSAFRTWGDLLEFLDRDLSPKGEVVTEARLNGVEQPTFREPAVTRLALADIDLVEVEAARPSALAARSLGEAVVALSTLQDATRQIAHAFRGNDLASANQGLSGLADGLRMLAALVGAVSLGLRMDVHDLPDEQSVNSTIVDLGMHVEALITAQRNQDWVALADTLQYDVEPALEKWRPVLDSLLESVAGDSRRPH